MYGCKREEDDKIDVLLCVDLERGCHFYGGSRSMP